MLVNVPKKKHKTDIRKETYYGFAIYARKNCGPDFMAAMNDGRISVSYGDTEVRYFKNISSYYDEILIKFI